MQCYRAALVLVCQPRPLTLPCRLVQIETGDLSVTDFLSRARVAVE